MIKIGSENNHNTREFTAKESEEMIAVWEKITKQAATRSIKVAEAYGPLDKSDSEWTILAKRVDDCIQRWAMKVRRLGGEPRALWTIAWTEDGRKRVWSLEPSFYVLPKKMN